MSPPTSRHSRHSPPSSQQLKSPFISGAYRKEKNEHENMTAAGNETITTKNYFVGCHQKFSDKEDVIILREDSTYISQLAPNGKMKKRFGISKIE